MIYGSDKVNDKHQLTLSFCKIQKDQWCMLNGHPADKNRTCWIRLDSFFRNTVVVESACDIKWKMKAFI